MTEMPGQMALFSLDGSVQEDQFADELCEECGTACTSSKECVETIEEIYGEEYQG